MKYLSVKVSTYEKATLIYRTPIYTLNIPVIYLIILRFAAWVGELNKEEIENAFKDGYILIPNNLTEEDEKNGYYIQDDTFAAICNIICDTVNYNGYIYFQNFNIVQLSGTLSKFVKNVYLSMSDNDLDMIEKNLANYKEIKALLNDRTRVYQGINYTIHII